jgi:charged multivesicular body protein 6
MGGGSSKPKVAPPPPKPTISATDRAILDLKNARDRLTRYRTKLERDDAKLVDQARRARDAGKTQQALGIMRLRKHKQVQAQQCEDQLLNVLQLVDTIDSKNNENAVFAAMTAGKDTLKRMHQETTVDDVLNLFDQITEQHEMEREINDILQNVPLLSVEQEEQVQAELNALMSETTSGSVATTAVNGLEQQLPNVPDTAPMPDVPTTKPEIKESTTVAPVKEQRQAVLS